jgi:hypothetical protein
MKLRAEFPPTGIPADGITVKCGLRNMKLNERNGEVTGEVFPMLN